MDALRRTDYRSGSSNAEDLAWETVSHPTQENLVLFHEARRIAARVLRDLLLSRSHDLFGHWCDCIQRYVVETDHLRHSKTVI